MAPKTSAKICGMGHSMKRKEDPRFLQGKGNYVDDIVLPDMLWLDIVRSPIAYGKIRSIDSSKALEVPGVLAVLTGKDLEAYNLHWMPTLMSDTQMVLPTDTVMYQAQEVAAVIATSRYAAADGVAAVEVDYDTMKPVIDPFKALEDDAPVLRTDKEGQTDNRIWHWEAGDKEATDKVFREADVVVRESMHVPRIHVASIETCGCVADFNPVEGHLTVYMTTQAPHAIRTVLALVAGHVGLSEEKIRVVSPDIGGGFGGKVPVYPGYVIAIAASVVLGKPVKWIEDRMENLQADSFARDYHMDAELAADADGRIRGLRIKTLADHGYADAQAAPSKFPAGLFSICTGSYVMDQAYAEVDAVYTNKPPGGVAYRCSFRVTEAVHCLERVVDTLAHKIGKDPATLREENFIPKEAFPYHSPLGWEYDSGDYQAAMDKAKEMIGYDALRKEQAEKRARGELMGIGVCSFTEVLGAGPSKDFDILGIKMFDSAEVRDPPHGQGDRQVRHQVAGPGPRDHLRADHRRGTRTPGRARAGRGGRHRHRALRAGHLRQPLDPDRRGRGRHGLPHDPCQGREDRGAPAGGERRGPRLGARHLLGEGRAGPVGDDPGLRLRGVHQPAAGDGAGARGDELLRPAQPHLPLRDVHLRRGHRPRHRRGEGAPFRGGGRLRQHHQPHDRAGADPRRPHAGHRPGPLRGNDLRRGRQQPRRLVHGLPHPDVHGDPGVGDGAHDHALTAPPARREGRRRVGDGRRAAGDRQRGGGCAGAPWRDAYGDPDHARPGVGGPQREGGRRVVRLWFSPSPPRIADEQ